MNGASTAQPIAAEDYFDQWLDHSAGRVRGTTLRGYESLMRIHIKPVLGRELHTLTPMDLQNLYSRLLRRDPPLSGGTVLNLHLVLTQALGQAVRWGYLPTNPANGAQPPRPRRRLIRGRETTWWTECRESRVAFYERNGFTARSVDDLPVPLQEYLAAPGVLPGTRPHNFLSTDGRFSAD